MVPPNTTGIIIDTFEQRVDALPNGLTTMEYAWVSGRVMGECLISAAGQQNRAASMVQLSFGVEEFFPVGAKPWWSNEV
jgi:hypothetical protein